MALAMLLTLDEAAARLTVSVSTVRRLTAAGLLLNDHAIPDDLREVADEVAE